MESQTIQPTNKYNRPPPPSKIILHGLDLCPPIQIRHHSFFRPSPQLSFGEVIQRLKSSLAEMLELYPPVGGSVRMDENDVLYIDTVTDGRDVAFLVEKKDTPFDGDSLELAPRTEEFLTPPAKAFAVKVTRFSCGTISIASAMHHNVTDLRGCLDFLERWAQVARGGEPIDFSQIPDDWSHTPGRFFSDFLPSFFSTIPPPGFTVSTKPLPPPAWLPSEVTKWWRITKADVERLEHDFSPSFSTNNNGGWISSGDAIASLLWGVITRARANAGVIGSDSEVQTLLSAADGRDKSPKGAMLNGKYFGNFNTLFQASASRSDLLSLKNESASRVALEIRNALIVQRSPESIASKIAFIETTKTTQPSASISFGGDVILANWCRFDLQGPKLDFGWGKPFATGDGGGLFPPGFIRLMQNSDGDILALVSVEEVGVNQLKADPLLNKYAKLVPV